MEPLATPPKPSATRDRGFGELQPGPAGLDWNVGGREVLSGLRLWVREGTAADQLIQLTEGVIVSERLGPPVEIEPTGRDAVGIAGGRHVRVEADLLSPGHLRITVEPADEVLRIGASWPLAASEHVTGGGCRHGLRFDQAGRLIDLGADRRYTGPDCPPDMIEAGGVPMGDYVPVPWLISSAGWAAWVECDGPGVQFDLQADVSLSIRAASGPLRLHLLHGPGPAALLRRYCGLTGFPQLLPEWAYGHWKSRDVYEHERDVLEDFDGYREHDLPLDAIVLDSPWETQYNTWEFNPWQFPDPEGLIAQDAARGSADGRLDDALGQHRERRRPAPARRRLRAQPPRPRLQLRRGQAGRALRSRARAAAPTSPSGGWAPARRST